jgi:hypothetical protein
MRAVTRSDPRQHVTPMTLDLACNNINAEGAWSLAVALNNNETLTSLNSTTQGSAPKVRGRSWRPWTRSHAAAPHSGRDEHRRMYQEPRGRPPSR